MKTLENYDVKIFTDNIEVSALEQIRELMSIDVFADKKIRVMPDVHAGAGCVIGFTGNLGDKVIPNIVGVDIGCGMRVLKFKMEGDIDFHAFNSYILNNVPSGRDLRDLSGSALVGKPADIYREAKDLVISMRCYRELKEQKRLYRSIGTLGGGNHFIELDRDDNGYVYLVIHTGSRNLGKQVADIYQSLALKHLSGWDEMMAEQQRIIDEYKAAGRRSELQGVIAKLHSAFKMRKPPVPKDLCYIEGQTREDYLHDMRLCQRWAVLNRQMIALLLMEFFPEVEVLEEFESVHNYIGDDNIIRKGSISAYQGERCIIPLNMRDGSLICIGKGNADWNNSAPHGAGRLMSRSQAYEQIVMADFEASMKGIFSESINDFTRDESPMVYKPASEIISNIAPTVDIETIIRPIFNFKASR